MTARRGAIAWSVVVALALAALAGCAVDETLPAPNCQDGGSGLIVAQSVPTAQLVPCFGRLPAGWGVGHVFVDESGTDVHLDSDRAGKDAAVLHFSAECELGEAVMVPSDQALASRYELVERLSPGFRSDRFYWFLGGCVRIRFEFDDGAPAGLAVELDDALQLIRRDDINQGIRETFIDEEL